MLRYKIINKNTKFVVFNTVKTDNNLIALKILRVFYSNNYLIEKV